MKFDVVVSDIGMPETDGYEFLRLLRRSGVIVPAMALTAFARAEDRLKAIQSGYQMHLAKPVDPLEFIVSVASLVGRIGLVETD